MTHDHTDIQRLIDHAQDLIEQAQSAGIFTLDGHPGTEAEHTVREQALQLATEMASALPQCQPSQLIALADSYDLTARIARLPRDHRTDITAYYDHAIHAWIEGDREIPQSDIFAMLRRRLLTRDPGITDRHRDIYRQLRRQWIDTLRQHDTFPGITSYETYRRLTLLLPLSLQAELGTAETALKERWYRANLLPSPSTNLITNHSHLTPKSLSPRLARAYRTFLSTHPHP